MENGTIISTTSSTVRRDDAAGTPIIEYINPSNFNLSDGDAVTMNVDESGRQPVATILSVINNNEPADEGTVRSGETINGSLTIPEGDVVTLKNSVINGDVKVEGKLISKSNSVINGDVKVEKTNAQLVMYASTVNSGKVSVKNGGSVLEINGSVINGDVKVENSQARITVDNLTIGGNKKFEIKNSSGTIAVNNLTVNGGKIEIKDTPSIKLSISNT